VKGKKTILSGLFLLALLVAVTPVIAACGSQSNAANATQPLKIGMMNPLTGVAAEKGRPMADGNLDAIKYINDELGGVAGHPIQVDSVDSEYKPATVVSVTKRFIDENDLLFTTAASAEMTAAMPGANEAGIPGLSAYTSPNLYRPPLHIYGQTPDYGDDALIFAQYYMKNIWKGSGKPTFALELLNNSTGYGARDAFKAKADSLGIQVLDPIFEHTATTTSEMDALTKIKAMKPDVLYISSTPAPTAVIIKNARDLGLQSTIGVGHAAMTSALVKLAGADVVEGVYGVYPTVGWGDNVPGMAKVTEYVKKYHPQDEGNMDYITSWAQSLIAWQILNNAVKNAGYDTLAKGGVPAWKAIETQGIQKLKSYDVQGLQGPASYTPGDNRLSKSVRVFQVKGGSITPITGWQEAPLVKYEDYPWFGK
jgi:branched-chain amino acid transport system substrate-binding protein